MKNAPARPNILLITASNHRADCFGSMGRSIRTPHLDRIIGNGTHFSACISPSHVGQPARASILSGLLPLSHGVVDNGIDLPEEISNSGFALHLQNHGYQTALIGKAHFSTRNTYAPTGRPECRFSGCNYPDSWHGPYAGFQYVELVQGHLTKLRPPLRPPYGLHYERWFFSRGSDDAAYRLWSTELPPQTTAAQTWHSALPVAWHSSNWVTDRAIAYIERQQVGQPFCLWTSFPDPHFPYDCPEPWSRLHDPEHVDLPEYRKLSFEGRPWWHRAALNGAPKIDDPVLKRSRSEGARITNQSDVELAAMTANYFGMLSLIDHNVGRMINALDRESLLSNTLIIYTSDSSDLLGDHGWHLKAPVAFEGMLRMPLVLYGSGIPCNRRCDEPVSTLDIPATIYDYCNLPSRKEIQSVSLLPLLASNPGARKVAYSEWNLHPSRCGVELQLRTVRTRRYKMMIEVTSNDGELYDLSDDPNELINRFKDVSYAKIRADLWRLLDERPGAISTAMCEPVGIA